MYHILATLNVLRRYLHPRIQLNKMTGDNGTALYQDCEMIYANILQLLLENNTRLITDDQNGCIPLMVAATHEIWEIIPKFRGDKILHKSQNCVPQEIMSFYGELFYTCSTQIHDKQILLAYDIDQGFLSMNFE